ncbi:MAG: hypothetical protein M3392_04095, partial [Actinomycetota bacterium]|nr:hypothetical protein [Actinomycetota bacterium]
IGPGRRIVYQKGAELAAPTKVPLPAVSRLDDGYVHVDLYGFFHVVGEGCEGDLGDHLHDLLVGVACLTYPIESFVGGVSPTLDDLLDKAGG